MTKQTGKKTVKKQHSDERAELLSEHLKTPAAKMKGALIMGASKKIGWPYQILQGMKDSVDAEALNEALSTGLKIATEMPYNRYDIALAIALLRLNGFVSESGLVQISHENELSLGNAEAAPSHPPRGTAEPQDEIL